MTLRETLALDVSSAQSAVKALGGTIESLAKNAIKISVNFDVAALELPKIDPQHILTDYEVKPLEVPPPDVVHVPTANDTHPVEVPLPETVHVPFAFDVPRFDPPRVDPIVIPVSVDLGGARGDLDAFASSARSSIGSVGQEGSAVFGGGGGGGGGNLFGQIALGAAVGNFASLGVEQIGSFAKSSIGAFTDFDSGVRQVLTLLPNASDDTFNQMSKGALDFARTTGRDPIEAIQAVYDAVSAGIPPDNVYDFMTTAGNAAIAGNTDLSSSVGGLTSVVNAYGQKLGDASTSNDDFTTASDIMFQTVNLGKLTFEELSRNISDVAPLGNSLGITFQELGAQIATITAVGVPASQATTQIRAAIAELGQPTSKLGTLFGTLAGQNFPEFIKSGHTLTDAFNLIAKHADDTGAPITSMSGSIEAAQAIMNTTGPNAGRMADFMQKVADSGGSSAKAFDIMSESAKFNFDRLGATVKSGLIEAGARFVPFLSTVAGFAADTLPKIHEITGKAIDAVGGAVTDVAGKAKEGLDVFTAAFNGEDIKPDGGLLSVIATFGTEAHVAFDEAKQILGVFMDAWNGTVDFNSGPLALVATLGTKAHEVFDFISNVVTQVPNLIGAIFGGDSQGVGEVVDNMLGNTGRFVDGVRDVFDKVKNYASAAFEFWSTVISSAIDNGKAIFNTLWPVVQDVASRIGDALQQVPAILSQAWDSVGKIIDLGTVIFERLADVVRIVSAVIQSDFIQGVLRVIATIMGDVVVNAVKVFIDVLRGAIKIIGDIAAALTDLLHGDWKGFLSNIGKIFADAFNVVKDVFGDLVGFVFDVLGHVAGAIDQALGGVPGKILGFLGGLFADIGSFIASAASTVAGVATTAWNVLVTVFTTVFEVIQGVVSVYLTVIGAVISAGILIWQEIIQPIIDGIIGIITIGWNTIAPIIQAVLDFITPIIETAFNIYMTVVQTVMGFIVDAIQVGWNLASTVIGTVLSFIQAAIQVAWDFYTAYVSTAMNLIWTVISTTWDIISTVFSTVLGVIQTVVTTAWDFYQTYIHTVLDVIHAYIELVFGIIQTVIQTILDAIKTYLQVTWDAISTIVRVTMDTIRGIIETVWGAISAVISAIVGAIFAFIQTEWNGIQVIIQTVMGVIQGIIQTVWPIIQSIIQGVVDTVRGIVQTGFDAVRGAIDAALSTAQGIVNTFRDVISTAFGAIQTILGNILGPIQSVYDKIVGTLGSIGSGVFSGITSAFGAIKDIVDDVIGAIQTAIDWIGTLIQKANPINDIKGVVSKLNPFGEWGGIFEGTPGVGIPINIGEAGKELLLPLTKGWDYQKALLARSGVLDRLQAEMQVSQGRRIAAAARQPGAAAMAPAAADGPRSYREGDTIVHVAYSGPAVNDPAVALEALGRRVAHATRAARSGSRRRGSLW